MKASDLKGMWVVSISEGIRLGVVHDIIFDPVHRAVACLAIESNDHKLLLPFSRVEVLGVDAVMVESSDDLSEVTDDTTVPEVRLSSLLGLQVIDTAGVLAGNVAEITIDDETGDISAIIVRRGGLLGIGAELIELPASAVRALGPEIVTVEPLADSPKA